MTSMLSQAGSTCRQQGKSFVEDEYDTLNNTQYEEPDYNDHRRLDEIAAPQPKPPTDEVACHQTGYPTNPNHPSQPYRLLIIRFMMYQVPFPELPHRFM